MAFRRVVTGMNGDKAVVLRDEQVESFQVEGSSMDLMWRTDGVPTVPNDGVISGEARFPDPGGSWVFSWTLEPNSSADKGNEMVEMGGERPGFHVTDTVDIDVILAGSIQLELDDGVKLDLVTGDIVVMNGTIHAWHNLTDESVTVLSVVVGAHRADSVR